MDAVPGYINKTWFKAARPGTFRASAPSCAGATTRTCWPACAPCRSTSTRRGTTDRRPTSRPRATGGRRSASEIRGAAREPAQSSPSRKDCPRRPWPSPQSHPRDDDRRPARGRRSSRTRSGPRRRAGRRGSPRPITRRSGSSTSTRPSSSSCLGGVEALLLRLQLGVAGQHLPDAGEVQPALHDARHDDDLPGRRAGVGRASRTTWCR